MVYRQRRARVESLERRMRAPEASTTNLADVLITDLEAARLSEGEWGRALTWCRRFQAREPDKTPPSELQGEAEWLYAKVYGDRRVLDPGVAEVWASTSPAIWAEQKLGLTNAGFHLEWYRLARDHQRLCLVAPRAHAKSSVMTINATAWTSIYWPGLWSYVFAATDELAGDLKARVDTAVEEACPDLVHNAISKSVHESVYANGSRVTAAGAGTAVQGKHPDRIIGDDVLTEAGCLTAYQRTKTSSWWFGTVGGMAHPGTTRLVPGRGRMSFPATQVILVGTPFHSQDLLMSMRTNAVWHFRRYAAEFDPSQLPRAGESFAVEIA